MKQKNNRPDSSPRVVQESKIKETFKIIPFNWTEKQKKFIDLALNKDISVIICKAPPGTGKTLTSLYCCLELLNQKKISDIVMYRCPIESSSKSIGYLKGEKDEKLSAYEGPLRDQLNVLLDRETINFLYKNNRIKIDSIGFAKGRTLNVQGIIVDEAEDLSIQELELLMTRLGKFSKMFIIGDVRQSNIKNSGFSEVFDLFNNEESINNKIATFEFTSEDCMRSPILKYILENFDKIRKK